MLVLGIVAGYLLVAIVAFRSMARRWLAEFDEFEGGSVVLLVTFAVAWPVAWWVAVITLEPLRDNPRRFKRLEAWVRR